MKKIIGHKYNSFLTLSERAQYRMKLAAALIALRRLKILPSPLIIAYAGVRYGGSYTVLK